MSGKGGSFFSVRLGINPNSSGHGILWGAMFFLPMSVVGTLLALLLDGELSQALERFRGGPPTPPGGCPREGDEPPSPTEEGGDPS